MAIAEPPPTLFNEILDFLISSPTPEQIIGFQTSKALNNRLNDLLDRNNDGRITAEERVELNEFLQIGHFMNMLKIRARKKLSA